MTKFIDTNIFIERWSNKNAKELTDNLDREKHCTSVLVLAEVYHKLKNKRIMNVFEYIRSIMGAITIYDFTKMDLFNGIKSKLDISVNDKINIAVMNRNSIRTIISYDRDFDKEKTIIREDP